MKAAQVLRFTHKVSDAFHALETRCISHESHAQLIGDRNAHLIDHGHTDGVPGPQPRARVHDAPQLAEPRHVREPHPHLEPLVILQGPRDVTASLPEAQAGLLEVTAGLHTCMGLYMRPGEVQPISSALRKGSWSGATQHKQPQVRMKRLTVRKLVVAHLSRALSNEAATF